MSDTYKKQPRTLPLPRAELAPIKGVCPECKAVLRDAPHLDTCSQLEEPLPPTKDRCPVCGGQGHVTKDIKILADDVLREIQRRQS